MQETRDKMPESSVFILLSHVIKGEDTQPPLTKQNKTKITITHYVVVAVIIIIVFIKTDACYPLGRV